jgi:hypothetical protein
MAKNSGISGCKTGQLRLPKDSPMMKRSDSVLAENWNTGILEHWNDGILGPFVFHLAEN